MKSMMHFPVNSYEKYKFTTIVNTHTFFGKLFFSTISLTTISVHIYIILSSIHYKVYPRAEISVTIIWIVCVKVLQVKSSILYTGRF